MIYIPECRVCGQEELAPDCLRGLSICGACWIAPIHSDLILIKRARMGRIETLVNIQYLRKNNTDFWSGNTGVE